MLPRTCNRKSGKQIKKQHTHILICFSIVVMTCLTIPPLVVAENSSYTPAAPTGPIRGYLNIEYTYMISSSNLQASWLFEWGDGTSTTWLQLQGSQRTLQQTHEWTSPGTYQVRVKYKSPFVTEVWSPSIEVIIVIPTENDFPTTPTITLSKTSTAPNIQTTYSVVSTDPNSETLQYRCDWGDRNISTWSTPSVSGSPVILAYSWTSAGIYKIKAQAINAKGLSSNWSQEYNITIQPDSDGDGLSDLKESEIGSDYTNPTDVRPLTIASTTHYLVEPTLSTQILFYNTISDISTSVGSSTDGTYLLDSNGDGFWDYSYDPLFLQLLPYQQTNDESQDVFAQIPWLWIIIGGIVLISVLIVVILYKKGYIYVYEELVTEESNQ